MKYFITVLVLLVLAWPVFAATDYTCMSNCSNQGYMYSYCKSKCSYDIYPTTKNTDYQCLNDCTAKGYMYSYCTDLCSY